jgi:hypothetical protein
MFRKLLLVAALSLVSGSAFATCGAIPLTIKDAGGNTQSISSATAGDGNCKTYIDADTSSQLHTDLTAAVPAGTNLIGKVGVDQTTPGTTNAVSVQYGSTASIADPCQTAAKVYTPINTVTANNTIIAGVSAKKKYICYIFIYPGAAVNFAVYQATTGTSCATAAADIFGGHTTATGFLATATAGFVAGNGAAAIAATNTVNTDICITNGGTVQLSGAVVTVDQ